MKRENVMRRSKVAYVLILGSFFIGCRETEFGPPFAEKGPIPLTGPDFKIERFQRKRFHPKRGEIRETLWSDGSIPKDPMTFVDPIRVKIPKSIQDKFLETSPYRTADGRMIERENYWGLATIVSLRPDIMILTIRKTNVDGAVWDDHPFREFVIYVPLHAQSSKLNLHTEFLGIDKPWLAFYAGRLLPYSEEMYLISNTSELKTERLIFDQGRVKIQAQGLSLSLIKTGSEVFVERD